MSAVKFDNVTIRLGGRDILKAASFEVREGEFVGMLGANGAGKTTLMRAALGLVPLSVGQQSPCSAGRRRAAMGKSATCRRAAERSRA